MFNLKSMTIGLHTVDLPGSVLSDDIELSSPSGKQKVLYKSSQNISFFVNYRDVMYLNIKIL